MLPDAACLFVADRRNLRAFVAPESASSILRLAFWDLQGTLARLEGLPELDPETALGEAWDAAVVVDPARRRLGAYAWGEFGESRGLQNALCSLFHARQPEWNLRWFARGMEDVRASLGVKERLTDEVRLIERPAWNLLACDDLACDDDGPYWNDCWVTLRDAVGQIRHVTLSSLHGGVALLRPEHLPLMRRFSEEMPPENEIRSGAWIDQTTREVLLWDVQPQGFLEDHLRPFWHDWNVQRQMDGWRLQAELSGKRVPKRRLERHEVEFAAQLLGTADDCPNASAALRAVAAGRSGTDRLERSPWSQWSASLAPDRDALRQAVRDALASRES